MMTEHTAIAKAWDNGEAIEVNVCGKWVVVPNKDQTAQFKSSPSEDSSPQMTLGWHKDGSMFIHLRLCNGKLSAGAKGGT